MDAQGETPWRGGLLIRSDHGRTGVERAMAQTSRGVGRMLAWPLRDEGDQQDDGDGQHQRR